jgi:hypothetical protein
LAPTHALRNGFKHHAGLEVRFAGIAVAPVTLGFGFSTAGMLGHEQGTSLPCSCLDHQPGTTREIMHRLSPP